MKEKNYKKMSKTVHSEKALTINNPKSQSKLVQDQVEGRNSVIELLQSGRDINKIIIQIKFYVIVLS